MGEIEVEIGRNWEWIGGPTCVRRTGPGGSDRAPGRTTAIKMLGAAALAATLFLAVGEGGAQNRTTVQLLAGQTHFHGVAAGGAASPGGVYLATHHGLYAVAADGAAERLSAVQDFMGFSPHPTQPMWFFASGHPALGGALGVVKSLDGGRTWAKLADGIGGPVDFHQMDVSAADPNVMYGAYLGLLQVSRDGGRSWAIAGRLPSDVIDVAASAVSADVVYAGAEAGLFRSADGGATWQTVGEFSDPVTMVQASPSGGLFVFVAGGGLLRTSETDLRWVELANTFGDEVVLHLAIEEARLFAVTINRDGQFLNVSTDGGRTWNRLE